MGGHVVDAPERQASRPTRLPLCLLIGAAGGKKYYVTIRHGLVEVVEDEPIAGTPEPLGVFNVSEAAFRKIALRVSQ